MDNVGKLYSDLCYVGMAVRGPRLIQEFDTLAYIIKQVATNLYYTCLEV